MITEWTKAVANIRREARKIEARITRIRGGNYDRKPAGRPAKKGTPKRKKVSSDNGYSGGTLGTSTGSVDTTQDQAPGG